MRTKSILTIMLVTAFSVITALGEGEPKRERFAVVPIYGSQTVKIIYKGEITGKIRINLYDDQLNLIYSDVFKGMDGFILPLNLKGLTSGEYMIEVIDSTKKHSHRIDHQPITLHANLTVSVAAN